MPEGNVQTGLASGSFRIHSLKGEDKVTKLFQTDIASEANLKVFVTDIRSEAELIVYETTDQWLATESPIWCYTDVQSDADKIVYFTQAQWDADLVVYKTDVQSDAGWVDSTKSSLL
jgi:hypothetical protein